MQVRPVPQLHSAPARSRRCAADALCRMLTLKATHSVSGKAEEEAWSDEWKVLVYDEAGRDIISPLLRVGELRRHGACCGICAATPAPAGSGRRPPQA